MRHNRFIALILAASTSVCTAPAPACTRDIFVAGDATVSVCGPEVLPCIGASQVPGERRGVDANGAVFQTGLERYIVLTREKAVAPVLLTPVAWRKCEDGKLVPIHGENPGCLREPAAAKSPEQDGSGDMLRTAFSRRGIRL